MPQSQPQFPSHLVALATAVRSGDVSAIAPFYDAMLEGGYQDLAGMFAHCCWADERASRDRRFVCCYCAVLRWVLGENNDLTSHLPFTRIGLPPWVLEEITE